jgi:molecular chaperone GrpE
LWVRPKLPQVFDFIGESGTMAQATESVQEGVTRDQLQAGDGAGPLVEPAPVEEVDWAAVVASAKAEAEEAKDAFLRAKAETENIRRRAAEDVQKAHKYALEKFARDLLCVKDSLDAALGSEGASAETLRSGVEITQKQLAGVFERFAISEVSAAGEKFDPNRHQAISQVASDSPPNTVVGVLQKGYLLADRVLRPALVTVAKGPEA